MSTSFSDPLALVPNHPNPGEWRQWLRLSIQLASGSAFLSQLSETDSTWEWEERCRSDFFPNVEAPLGVEDIDPGSCQNDSWNPQRNKREA